MRPKYRIISATIIALTAVFFLTSAMALAVDKKCDPTKCAEVCKVPCNTATAKQANATQVNATQASATTCPKGDSACCKMADGKCPIGPDGKCTMAADGKCTKAADGKCCMTSGDKTCPKTGEACCQKNASKASATGTTCPHATSGCPMQAKAKTGKT